MKLGMNQLEIGETFKSLALFKALAPIAEILKGKLDSDIELSGALTDDFTPDLLTLSGDMLANIFTKDVDASSANVIDLDNNLGVDTKGAYNITLEIDAANNDVKKIVITNQ